MAMAKVVMRGPLFQKGSGAWKRRAVVVFCGSENDGKLHSACMALYDNHENAERAGDKKPMEIIQLVGAKIKELTYSSPIRSQGSPRSGGTLFLVIHSNKVNEFRSESGVHWPSLLTLLTMFPYSVIPEEPNPISDGFRYKVDPKSHGADSAWTVYIMPEEVGSRCNMLGVHILLLRGGIPNQSVGQLQIVSQSDVGKPIVAWDRDKMRRTGMTWNLVFIEIGQRCQGGPGLVWMYAGPKEAYPLRETLHRFLFEGDGKAVSIPTRDIFDSSRPRYSVNTSLPSSYKRSQSSSSFKYSEVSVGQDSPISLSCSPAPAQDVPPPVLLYKHPSFRKQCSVPVPHSSRCSASPSGSFGVPSQQSYSHSVGSFNDDEMFDERAMSRQSVSPHDDPHEENEESGSRQFRMDSDFGASSNAHHHCETMLPRQEQHEYETMCHPSHSRLHKAHEDYIKRLPAFVSLTIPQPVVPSNYDVPPIPRPFVPSNYDVPPIPRPFVPSNYDVPPIPQPFVPSNYDVPPIPRPFVPSNYDVPPIPQPFVPSNYDVPPIPRPFVPSNYDVPPIPRPFVPSNYDVPPIPRPFVPSNYDVPPIPRLFVPLIDEDLPQQPFRSLTSNMEKGQYTPPKNKNGPHLHYAQRQSSTAVSPPGLPPRVPVVCPTSRLVTHHRSSLPPYPLIIKETSAYLTEAETGKLIIFIPIITSHITSRSRFGSNWAFMLLGYRFALFSVRIHPVA